MLESNRLNHPSHCRAFNLPRALLLLVSLLLLAACSLPGAAEPTPAPLVPTPGALSVANAWVRSVPVADGSSAAYLDILNGTDSDVRLVAAQTSAAGVTELHETTTTDSVLSMQHAPDGWTIPAGESLSLAPGGKHIMLMMLAAPLAEGNSITLALTFDNGTVQFVTAPVRTVEE